jgi:predicted alpha/beta-fold hydrolase
MTKNLIDIATHLTAKAFGYETLENYYDTASCIHRIPKIKTPTFFMMAKDDPIIGPKAIAYQECQANPYVLLGVTEHGGHLGFFESVTSTDQWFVEPVFEFIMQFS